MSETHTPSTQIPDAIDAEQLPLISCICATYNRPPHYRHLLEEAVESFVRQDYPNKELIIVNDTPGQVLQCAVPGVRILNANFRMRSIGDKHNMAVAAAQGEYIAVWDDDDISLPWRLSLSIERIGDADYFNPGQYWFLDRDRYHHAHGIGVAHNASLYLRSTQIAVGGYPPLSQGEDQKIDAALRRGGTVAKKLAGMSEIDRWFYIYRWGVSPGHISGRTDLQHYADIGKRPIAAGEWLIEPRWQQDYVADTRAYIETNGLQSPRNASS